MCLLYTVYFDIYVITLQYDTFRMVAIHKSRGRERVCCRICPVGNLLDGRMEHPLYSGYRVVPLTSHGPKKITYFSPGCWRRIDHRNLYPKMTPGSLKLCLGNLWDWKTIFGTFRIWDLVTF